MPIKIPKETKNCRIRDFVIEDVPLLADIEFDSDVKRYIGLPKGPKEEWIAKNQPAFSILRGYAIETITTNEFAGRVALVRAKTQLVELEIVIAKKFWGRRFGREVVSIMLKAAFNECNAKAVIAEVHPDNHPSIALLQDFGFYYESESQKEPMQLYKLTKEEIGA